MEGAFYEVRGIELSPVSCALSQGDHNFRVKAIDASGTEDPTAASRSWNVDNTAPKVDNVSPADGTTGVSPTANVTATFSEAIDPTTLTTSTFTLIEQGSSTPVPAAVRYDSTNKQATLDPSSDLAPNTTYTATVKGASSGVKDPAGNPLAQDHSWTFTTATASTLPTVVSYAPEPCCSSPAPGLDTNVTATFSKDMDPVTITDTTFTLTRQFDQAPVAATVTYDAASKTATLDPFVRLSDSTKYTALIKSGSD